MPQTIEEKREYQRKHYLANKQKYKDRASSWYYSNTDKAKENVRKYQKKNSEKKKQWRETFNTKHPLYGIWRMMKQRCFNPNKDNYHYYGGRGITIYDPWIKSYKEFEAYILETLGPRPNGRSLDRIDNDMGYLPGNLRYANASEQMLNRRKFKWKPTRKGFNRRNTRKELH